MRMLWVDSSRWILIHELNDVNVGILYMFTSVRRRTLASNLFRVALLVCTASNSRFDTCIKVQLC